MDSNDDTDLYGDLVTGGAEEGQGHLRAEAEEVGLWFCLRTVQLVAGRVTLFSLCS